MEKELSKEVIDILNIISNVRYTYGIACKENNDANDLKSFGAGSVEDAVLEYLGIDFIEYSYKYRKPEIDETLIV